MSGREPGVLGRMDCPCCGTKDGMRFTKDKNGAPFGFCDAVCGVQLRIGGSPYRVEKFTAAHPDIVGGEPAAPVTVTVPEPVKAKREPEQIQEPQAVRRVGPMESLAKSLAMLGGGGGD